MDTTFYFALQPRDLHYLLDKVTIWLPEHLPMNPEIWNSGQVIATCDMSWIFRIRDRIQAGTLAPDKVIWIEIKHQKAVGYIFGTDGKIANFFRIV